jgi:hypothetical protein
MKKIFFAFIILFFCLLKDASAQDVYSLPEGKVYIFQVGNVLYEFNHAMYNPQDQHTFVYAKGMWEIHTSKLIICFYYSEVRYILKR